MIDNQTQTARHELGGRELYLRRFTVGQMVRLSSLQATEQWAEFTAGGRVRLDLDPQFTAELLSLALTDAAANPAAVTAAEVTRWPLEQFVELLNDFFSLNPSLRESLTAWLLATLNWPAGADSGAGRPGSSGCTSPPPPAADGTATPSG